MTDGSCHWSLGEGVPSNLLGGTADAPAPGASESLSPGAVIAEQYRVVALLGRGASGTVYRVEQPGAGRQVALKLLSSTCDRGDRDRLLREGQVTAALDHPGIGRVFSAGEHDGRAFLVFELLEDCQTLEAVFDGLPREEALRVVLEVAEAIGYAHGRGVLHRDVKPENILLDAQGRPRVIDFGLARGQDQERLTQTGALLGTPLYMAPECFNEPDAVGPHTDVWALGVMLYRALSRGRYPFYGDRLPDLALQIEQGKPASVRATDPTVSSGLEAVWRRALATRIRLRYPDAVAFADDLRRALKGEPVVGARSGRGPLLALAGVVVAAGLGVGGYAWSQREAPPLEPPPIAATPKAKPPPARIEARLAGVAAALQVKDSVAASRHALRIPEGPLRTVVLARIGASRGEDPVALMARAKPEAHPVSSEEAEQVQAQLATLYDADVLGGNLARAMTLAALVQERWPSATGPRTRALIACAGSPDPKRLRQDLPSVWRDAVFDYLCQRSQREAAFLIWAGDAQTWVRTSSNGSTTEAFVAKLRLRPKERLARAQAWLAAAEGLRARPAFGVRRKLNAVPSFRGLSVSPDREQACGILVKASARSGARQPNPAGRPLQEYLDVVLTLDPDNQPARYFAARERFRAGNLRALKEAVEAVVRCPHLNRFLHYDLLLWAAEQRLQDKPSLWTVRGLYPAFGIQRLVRVVVAAAALESEGATDPGLLAECYQDSVQALKDYPAALPANTAHAFLALRTHHLGEARDALAWTLEALESPVAEFYRGLLLMREGATADAVLAPLRRAKAQRFGGFTGDLRGLPTERYPEVKPYVRLPAFRGYFRLPD